MTHKAIEKESEAWFSLAKYFYATPKEREFLCLYLIKLYGTCDMVDRMRSRILADLSEDDEGVAYFSIAGEWMLMTDRERHDGRVMAALMFGWEAKGEGR